jgi:hypothetical protein
VTHTHLAWLYDADGERWSEPRYECAISECADDLAKRMTPALEVPEPAQADTFSEPASDKQRQNQRRPLDAPRGYCRKRIFRRDGSEDVCVFRSGHADQCRGRGELDAKRAKDRKRPRLRKFARVLSSHLAGSCWPQMPSAVHTSPSSANHAMRRFGSREFGSRVMRLPQRRQVVGSVMHRITTQVTQRIPPRPVQTRMN